MGLTAEHGGVAKESKEAVLNERRVLNEKQARTRIRTGSCLGMGPGVATKIEN